MKEIMVCAVLVIACFSGFAQENKYEVSLSGGIAMTDMNFDKQGVGTQIHYSHWFRTWLGTEARLGLVQYNNFPTSSSYRGSDRGWGVSNEFDAYIRTIPIDEAILTSWSQAAFYTLDASVFVSPIHTEHHSVKLYAGVTRQYRATTELLLVSIERLEGEPNSIADYTPRL